MTAELIHVSPSATPQTPDSEAVSALVHAGKQEQPAVSPVAAATPRLPIKVERDDDGTYLVSNSDDQVVGTGSTLDQAMADFQSSLIQRIRYLRANRERLHPKLVEALHRLELDFPWV